jgi:tetratricopeptide (TPR) repeat protein
MNKSMYTVKKNFHKTLARYFEKQLLILDDEMEKPNIRKFMEEPWQLSAAGDWLTLIEILVSPDFFSIMLHLNKEIEWMQYWQVAKSTAKEDTTLNSIKIDINIPNLYKHTFSQISDKKKSFLLGPLSQLLIDLGYYSEAKTFLEQEAEILSKINVDHTHLVQNYNGQGLALRYQSKHSEAIEFFQKAEKVLVSYNDKDKIEKRLATILMNQAASFRALNNATESVTIEKRALLLMKNAYGEFSPGVATTMQGIGNSYFQLKDYNNSLSWHLKAYQIRKYFYENLPVDVGLSLGNIAGTVFKMKRFYAGELLCERALQIFTQYVGIEHPYSINMQNALADIRSWFNHALNSKSEFGLILLVFESAQHSETQQDSLTLNGIDCIGQSICNSIMELYDVMIMYRISVPILIVSFPGFEKSIEFVQRRSEVKKLPNSHLKWINLSEINPDIKREEDLLPLVLNRNQIISWFQEHSLKGIMVKPFKNIGSHVDPSIFNFILKQQSTSNSGNGKKRILTLETLDFDNNEAPIIGLSTDNNDPHPCFIPQQDWKDQHYHPKKEDLVANGTFYINLSELSCYLNNFEKDKVNPIDDWSMTPLLEIATSNRKEQLHIFEKALSELTNILSTDMIHFEKERGLKGYQDEGNFELNELNILINDLQKIFQPEQAKNI